MRIQRFDLEVTSMRIAAVRRYGEQQRVVEVLADVWRGVDLHGKGFALGDTVRIVDRLNPLIGPRQNTVIVHPLDLELRLQHNYVVLVDYDNELEAYIVPFGPSGVFEVKDDSLVQLEALGHSMRIEGSTGSDFLEQLRKECRSRPRQP